MGQLSLIVLPDSPGVFSNDGQNVVAVPLRPIPFYGQYTPIMSDKLSYSFACDTKGNVIKTGTVNAIVGKEFRISDLSCTYSHEGNFTPNIKFANASGPVASAQIAMQISSHAPSAEAQTSYAQVLTSNSPLAYFIFGVVIAILAGFIYLGRNSLHNLRK